MSAMSAMSLCPRPSGGGGVVGFEGKGGVRINATSPPCRPQNPRERDMADMADTERPVATFFKNFGRHPDPPHRHGKLSSMSVDSSI